MKLKKTSYFFLTFLLLFGFADQDQMVNHDPDRIHNNMNSKHNAFFLFKTKGMLTKWGKSKIVLENNIVKVCLRYFELIKAFDHIQTKKALPFVCQSVRE